MDPFFIGISAYCFTLLLLLIAPSLLKAQQTVAQFLGAVLFLATFLLAGMSSAGLIKGAYKTELPIRHILHTPEFFAFWLGIWLLLLLVAATMRHATFR